MPTKDKTKGKLGGVDTDWQPPWVGWTWALVSAVGLSFILMYVMPALIDLLDNDPVGIDPPSSAHVMADGKERNFIQFAPRQFKKAFGDDRTDAEGQQEVAAYIGNWIALKGRVQDVLIGQTVSFVDLENRLKSPRVNMHFNNEIWRERLAVLKKDQEISAYCAIESIRSYELGLTDCNLLP
jgi:hypothetical protein